MKKILSILLVITLLLSCSTFIYGADMNKRLYTDTYLVMDLKTGEVLSSKNADTKRYPASTTKMLTALIAIENLKPGDMLVADDEVADTEGSSFGLKVGEQISFEDALNIMLLKSANDIAVLFAKEIGGSVENFARMMNQKLDELGCVNSHFVTPNGLHDDDHYTTANDLAIIARALMSNETLAKIVGQSKYEYSATNRRSGGVVNSTNLLMEGEQAIYVGNVKKTTKYENAKIIGIKTGTTPEAGGCLVAAAEKDGTTIMTIVLKSGSGSALERYADSQLLLDWAFENYRTEKLASKGDEFGVVKVRKGEFNKVTAVLAEDIYVTLPKEASAESYKLDKTLIEKIVGPIEEGVELGTVTVSESGNVIGTYEVVAKNDIKKGGILSVFGIEDAAAAKIFGVLKIILGVFIILVVIVLILRVYNKRKARLRREARARKKAELEAKKRMEWDEEYERQRQNRNE